jgi:hypothetical protein
VSFHAQIVLQTPRASRDCSGIFENHCNAKASVNHHVDRQTRIAAVAALEALGFKYTSDRGWLPPINSGRGAIGGAPPEFSAQADAMHALLVIRADALMGEPQASADGMTELQHITDAVEGYETKRWPPGKVPGGKG